jgi:hypothetical protein
MKAISVAVIAILAAAAMAITISGCTDTTCTNCTAQPSVAEGCTSLSGASSKAVCSGDNVTVTGYTNSDCSGTGSGALSYKTGCSVIGSASIKVSCGASASAVVVAVAAIVAALLF